MKAVVIFLILAGLLISLSAAKKIPGQQGLRDGFISQTDKFDAEETTRIREKRDVGELLHPVSGYNRLREKRSPSFMELLHPVAGYNRLREKRSPSFMELQPPPGGYKPLREKRSPSLTNGRGGSIVQAAKFDAKRKPPLAGKMTS